MRAIPSLSAVVLLAAALARPASARSVEPKILGWSSDGVRFLYATPVEDAGELDDMGGGSATVQLGIAVDGRTGIAERYLISSSGKPTAKERAEWKALPGAAAWNDLVKASGARCDGGRASPDGAATAEIAIKGKQVKGRWNKAGRVFSFGYEGDDIGDEIAATLMLSVARAGKSVLSESMRTAGPGGGTLSGDVRVCWSPTGRRVAWIVRRAPGMMRDPGEYSVLVGPTTAPRIQLVADKSVLAQAAAKVGAALEAAGIVSTSAKPSNEATARPATVIYAATGFEADAQRIAAAIPGGATVAKLDWKPPFDIVVGIGATALK
jgi:hypothetical protein